MRLSKKEKIETRQALRYFRDDATHYEEIGGHDDGRCGLRQDSDLYKILTSVIRKIETDLDKE